ncbi:hypothetical protein [Staphylothermus marinus]|uniref:hypothetical protein n=1 Tax=Staphylothermus marinus TaxID=2280 RepID=UPI0003215CF0|nr:hypothetical protein [Staphylothermus marinus]
MEHDRVKHLESIVKELEELTNYSREFLKLVYRDKHDYQINMIIKKATMIYKILVDTSYHGVL